MSILMEVVTTTSQFPWVFPLVYVVGFVAAVTIGSIAWYNSKRPPGWEGADRPDIVPKVAAETEEESEADKQG